MNVVCELIAPSALGDGYRVEAQIVTWTATDVVKIPTSALSRSGAELKVFVVEDGRARAWALQIGHRGSDEVEVIDGLSVGDDVILFPSDRMRDAFG